MVCVPPPGTCTGVRQKRKKKIPKSMYLKNKKREKWTQGRLLGVEPLAVPPPTRVGCGGIAQHQGGWRGVGVQDPPLC